MNLSFGDPGHLKQRGKYYIYPKLIYISYFHKFVNAEILPLEYDYAPANGWMKLLCKRQCLSSA